MIVEGYSMDLYCDGEENCRETVRTGEVNKAVCVRKAKKWGWHFNWGERLCYCPNCWEKRKHKNVRK